MHRGQTHPGSFKFRVGVEALKHTELFVGVLSVEARALSDGRSVARKVGSKSHKATIHGFDWGSITRVYFPGPASGSNHSEGGMVGAFFALSL
jgi:hypothetical protein